MLNPFLMSLLGLLYMIMLFDESYSISSEDAFLHDFFLDKNVQVSLINCRKSAENVMLTEKVMKNTQHSFLRYGFSKSIDVENMKTYKAHHYIVADLRGCRDILMFLKKVNEFDIYRYPLKFLVIVNEEYFVQLSNAISNFKLLPSTELFIIHYSNSQDRVLIWDPYKVSHISKLEWTLYGHWSEKEGLVETNPGVSMTRRRSDLKNATLEMVIVIFDDDSINRLTDYSQPGVDTFAKLDYVPITTSLELLNARFRVTSMKSYGYYQPTTGKFDGLVGAVAEWADLSGSTAYFSADRFALIDYLPFGNILAIRFIVTKPSTSYMKNIFYITFSKSVWLAIGIVMVLFTVMSRVIVKWESRENMVQYKKNVEYYRGTDVYMISLEAICQQGTTIEPRSLSGRIIIVILFTAFMFLYVSYSANIVVLLQSNTVINNLKELAESRIDAGAQNTPFMQNYLQRPKGGPLRDLYLNKISRHELQPLEIGMQRLQEGNFAYHVTIQSAYEYILKKFTNHEICKLQELPGYVINDQGYVVVPKHSPYKDVLKVAFLRIEEKGLRKRTNLRLIMKPKCFSHAAIFKSVGIYDCEQIFIIWTALTAVAILIFLVEFLFGRLVKFIKLI